MTVAMAITNTESKEIDAMGGSTKPLMKPIQIGLHQLKHR